MCSHHASDRFFKVMWHVDMEKIRLIFNYFSIWFLKAIFWNWPYIFEVFEKKKSHFFFNLKFYLAYISHEVWRARKGIESFNVKACLLPI
jgi:hypothetical protein